MSILNPINDAVAWVIVHIYNVLGPVFGATSGVTWVLSIIILVIAMRVILLPLFIKQMHTQRAMTALTPKIQEIRKKYKGDKERLNAETMKLYQEAGVNPLMGCLPVVLQMPLFFALFEVLRAIAEPKAGQPLPYGLSKTFVSNVNASDIFGVHIKDTFLHATSLHVHAVILIVVLISMATTYLTVRQSMKRGMMPTGAGSPMGQSQKLMAYVMPLFALTGLYWPFGLVLYWVTTNFWTLGQQFVLLRRYPVGAAAAAEGGNLPIGKTATAPGFTGGRLARLMRPPAADGGAGAKSAQAPAAAPGGSATPDRGRGVRNGSAKSAGTAKPAATAANGHKPAGGDGGMLRRFARGRPAPEPTARADADTKIVRHQPQRQSRSKRTGKR